MTFSRFLIFAVCICAIECGSGGPAPLPPTPPPASPGNLSWQYTALGDSLAVGILASTGYVPRYQQYLETDNGATVSLTNLGQNGWKSADLLHALLNDPSMRTSLMNAQVVTWDIGGNDLLRARRDYLSGTCGGSDNQDCLRTTITSFTANWDAIVTEIVSLRNPQSTILRTMDVYNPFVAEDRTAGRFDILNPYLLAINSHIVNSTANNQIPCAKVHEAFNGKSGDEDALAKGYISVDNIHPNDAGHKVIADLLRGLAYAPLASM